MDPQGGCGAQRRAKMFGGQSLFVETMSGFMEDTVKGLGEIPLIVTRREPAISRAQRDAERMRGRVNPARLKVKTDRFGNFPVQRLLRGDRIIPLQQVFGHGGGALPRALENRSQCLA